MTTQKTAAQMTKAPSSSLELLDWILWLDLSQCGFECIFFALLETYN